MAGRIERGEIRLYRFPEPDKERPVLILTRGSAIPYLSRLTVAPITPTIRGVPSEVALGTHEGMRQSCAANLHDIMTVGQKGSRAAFGATLFASHAGSLCRDCLRLGLRRLITDSRLIRPSLSICLR